MWNRYPLIQAVKSADRDPQKTEKERNINKNNAANYSISCLRYTTRLRVKYFGDRMLLRRDAAKLSLHSAQR